MLSAVAKLVRRFSKWGSMNKIRFTNPEVVVLNVALQMLGLFLIVLTSTACLELHIEVDCNLCYNMALQ